MSMATRISSFGASHEGPVRRTVRSVRESQGAVELSYFHILWIFILASVVGLVVETLVSYPFDGEWKSRVGLIWGPFSPIYGLGAVLFTVTLNRFDRAPVPVVFVAAGVVGAAFEFAAGYFWEHAFGIVAWSYLDQPFNLLGYTSLGMAVVWGAAGLAWSRVVPHVVRLIDHIPRTWRGWTSAVLTVFLAADVAMTFVGFACWFDRLEGNEPQGIVQLYFAEHYDDEFMAERFETMSMWPVLADLRG